MNKFSLSLRSLKNDRTQLKKGAGAIAFSIMVLTLISTSVNAQQSLQIGLKAGANFFKVGGRSMDTKIQPGFSGGAYGELNFTSHWTLQPELLFNQTVTQTSDIFNQIYPGNGVSHAQAINNYVALPVLIVFKPVPELSILVGPQYGYLVSQTKGLLYQEPNKGAFSKSDFSLVFGGQLNLGKVKVGARYSAGLNNINGINTSDTWRQYGFQTYLAYQIKDIKLKKKK